MNLQKTPPSPLLSTNERPPVAVFAYSEVGYACLEELFLAGANVVVVFTHEDAGDEAIWFRSVARLAASHNIPVRTEKRITGTSIDLLKSLRVEVVFSFYYRAVIPREVLDIPRLGAFNMHGALLPKYRGRACVNWAVLNGETKTGVTLHEMTEEPDKGDIVDQESIPILTSDTAFSVFLKIAGLSRIVLSRNLPAIESGTAPRTKQDESQATTFGRRRPADGEIDWNKRAADIFNLVRALTHPFPGAFTHIDGKKTYVWRAGILETLEIFPPGKIISRHPLLIAAKDGLLTIQSFQAEGEPEVSYHA